MLGGGRPIPFPVDTEQLSMFRRFVPFCLKVKREIRRIEFSSPSFDILLTNYSQKRKKESSSFHLDVERS